MTAKERFNAIKELVTRDKKVSVSNLNIRFGVTEETIRRDLEKLELEGIVTRTYGGAVLNQRISCDALHFYRRASICVEEKIVIAQKTLALLCDKSTIAADSSSTAMEVLKLLKNRSDLTLLTNSTEALQQLLDSELNIISTGGILNKCTLSLQGPVAKQAIKNYNVDVALISCKGLDEQKGALDSNETEAELKKLIVSQATEVALLIDHTKFDRTAFVQLVDFDHINYIVTDSCPSDKWISLCREQDIQLIY